MLRKAHFNFAQQNSNIFIFLSQNEAGASTSNCTQLAKFAKLVARKRS